MSSTHEREQRPGSAQWTLVLASVGAGLMLLQTTAVNVALPVLGAHLHAGITALQWCVNGYAIAFAATLLPFGALVDRRGARFMFVLGLMLFAAASALSGLAVGVSQLVAGQVLAGVAGAMIAPSSLSLLGGAFPDARRRTHAIGVMSLGLAAGFGSGPVIGGALLSWMGWRGVFLVNAPLALALVPLTLWRVAPSARRFAKAPDALGVLLAVCALGTLTFALIEGGHRGLNDPLTWASIGTAVVSCALFVGSQRRGGNPLVPARLLSGSSVPAAAAMGMILNFSVFGLIFVLSVYLQQTLKLSPLHTGLLLAPQALGTALVAVFVGRWIGRVGPRPPLVGGWIVMAAGTIIVAVWGSNPRSR
jgi:DHA2 family methylenomycin A resistance protein-like MFS transporter